MLLFVYNKGIWDWGVFLGSGVMLWVVWLFVVILGYFVGSLILDLKVFGLDVIFLVFFIVLFVLFWKSRW